MQTAQTTIVHCKDCKFYDSRNFLCDKVEYTKNQNEPILDTSMLIICYAWDDSGLEARLHTGPLFGCLEGKVKE